MECSSEQTVLFAVPSQPYSDSPGTGAREEPCVVSSHGPLRVLQGWSWMTGWLDECRVAQPASHHEQLSWAVSMSVCQVHVNNLSVPEEVLPSLSWQRPCLLLSPCRARWICHLFCLLIAGVGCHLFSAMNLMRCYWCGLLPSGSAEGFGVCC